MEQHRFDPISFIFGLLFIGVGLPLVLIDSGVGVFKASWLVPAILVVAGLIVLGSAISGQEHTEESPQSDDEAPAP